MIDIIMPTLNAAEFLAEALDSIEAQTYKDWSLLVVDGGSTDGTLNVLEHYSRADSRIRYHLIPNEGIAHARNYGLKWSGKPYVVPMGADDMMLPDRLEKQLKAIQKHNVDVVYSDYIECDYKGRPMGVFKTGKIEKATLDQVRESQIVPHDTIMAKRENFEKHTYRNENRDLLDDDHYLILGWFKLGLTFKKMNSPILLKRYHDNQHYRVHYDKYISESKKLKDLL